MKFPKLSIVFEFSKVGVRLLRSELKLGLSICCSFWATFEKKGFEKLNLWLNFCAMQWTIPFWCFSETPKKTFSVDACLRDLIVFWCTLSKNQGDTGTSILSCYFSEAAKKNFQWTFVDSLFFSNTTKTNFSDPVWTHAFMKSLPFGVPMNHDGNFF